jgi:hypothetical protein
MLRVCACSFVPPYALFVNKCTDSEKSQYERYVTKTVSICYPLWFLDKFPDVQEDYNVNNMLLITSITTPELISVFFLNLITNEMSLEDKSCISFQIFYQL